MLVRGLRARDITSRAEAKREGSKQEIPSTCGLSLLAYDIVLFFCPVMIAPSCLHTTPLLRLQPARQIYKLLEPRRTIGVLGTSEERRHNNEIGTEDLGAFVEAADRWILTRVREGCGRGGAEV